MVLQVIAVERTLFSGQLGVEKQVGSRRRIGAWGGVLELLRKAVVEAKGEQWAGAIVIPKASAQQIAQADTRLRRFFKGEASRKLLLGWSGGLGHSRRVRLSSTVRQVNLMLLISVLGSVSKESCKQRV